MYEGLTKLLIKSLSCVRDKQNFTFFNCVNQFSSNLRLRIENLIYNNREDKRTHIPTTYCVKDIQLCNIILWKEKTLYTVDVLDTLQN